MKYLKFILIAYLALTSCSKSNGEPADTPPETTPQTTLMYMTGTDLSYYYGLNITALKKAIAQDALGYSRFLLFKHSSSDTGNLMELRHENGACVIDTLESYTNITSLSLDSIEGVIGDAKQYAPADSYNLIMSGHATAWVPKSQSNTWEKVAPLSPASSSTSESINWESMISSPIVTRYMGSSNDSYFDISEFKEALEAADTHFGYIIFDECFMSSIEALYPLRNLCDYIIASPCEIMGDGFPYSTVLFELYANKGREYDLQGVCEAYYNYYSTYTYPSGCVALAVCAELEALADITLAINHNHSIDDDEIELDQIQAYERLDGHLFFDFEQYMVAKCTNSNVAEVFLEQMQRAFPTECRFHTERFFANIGVSASSANNYAAYYTTINYYSGVTTSQPSSRMTSYWAATEWAIQTN